MDAFYWEKIRTVYQAALDRPDQERSDFINSACAGDAGLRREVCSLLEIDQRASGFLEPFAAFRSTLLSVAPMRAGTRIGAYTIRRLLGAGGMAVVYEAEQERPRRRVALKVVRAGSQTGSTLRRMEHEAHILARLQHPGIAQIFEAGGTETVDGLQPYFAMELVDGRPLTEFAAEHGLPVRDRVALIIAACRAVEHAHQKGVIHRDLKPANILVTPEGDVKVLDFGIARVCGTETETRQHTHTGQLLGTLPYMSPEQARGASEDIDTRTDVYGLGVTLFQLVSGRLPFPADGSLVDVIRKICEEAPPSPRSVRPSKHGLEQAGSDETLVPGTVDRDLSTIILKALSKEPARRYQSVGELRADLQRHAAGEAIEARRDSPWYVLGKSLARRRGAVAVAAAFLLLITGSTIALGWMYGRAEAQRIAAEVDRDRAHEAQKLAEVRRVEAETDRREAVRQAAIASAVSDFFEGVLTASHPEETQGKPVTLEEYLDRVAVDIEGAFADQPEVGAAVHYTVGRQYSALGKFSEAIQHLKAAVALRREHLPEDDPALADALARLGYVHAALRDADSARPVLDEALRIQREALPANDARTASTLWCLSTLELGQSHYDEAARIASEALQRCRSAGPPADWVAANCLHTLGDISRERGDAASAEQSYRDAIEIRQRLPGRQLEVSKTKSALAELYMSRGDLAAAETMLNEALQLQRLFLGDHASVAQLLGDLGMLYRRTGDFERAEQMHREALAIYESDPQRFPFHIGQTLVNLGAVRLSAGDLDEAQRLLTDGLARLRNAAGESNINTLMALNSLGNLQFQRGDFSAAAETYDYVFGKVCAGIGEHSQLGVAVAIAYARTLARLDRQPEALALFERVEAHAADVLSEKNAYYALYESYYGDCLVDLDRHAEAEPRLLRSHDLLCETLGPDHEITKGAVRRLAKLYTKTGQTVKAERYRLEFEPAAEQPEAGTTP